MITENSDIFSKWENYYSAMPYEEEARQELQIINESYQRVCKVYEEDCKYETHKDDKILDTEQLRFMLHYALQHAKKYVWISCPWIKYLETEEAIETFLDMSIEDEQYGDMQVSHKTIGEEIIELLKKDDFEGLYIQFGYSPGKSNNLNKEIYSLKAISMLFDKLKKSRKLKSTQKQKLKVYHVFGNHQKMLIMDNSLMIVGSYNFLSFEGDTYSKGNIEEDCVEIVRKERGYCTKNTNIIEDTWNKIIEDEETGYYPVLTVSDIHRNEIELNTLRERYCKVLLNGTKVDGKTDVEYFMSVLE